MKIFASKSPRQESFFGRLPDAFEIRKIDMPRNKSWYCLSDDGHLYNRFQSLGLSAG
jgi:hypothetical protein